MCFQFQVLKVLNLHELWLQEPINLHIGSLIRRQFQKSNKVNLIFLLALQLFLSFLITLSVQATYVEASNFLAAHVRNVICNYMRRLRVIAMVSLPLKLFADHHSPLLNLILRPIFLRWYLFDGWWWRVFACLARNVYSLTLGRYFLQLVITTIDNWLLLILELIILKHNRIFMQTSSARWWYRHFPLMRRQHLHIFP